MSGSPRRIGIFGGTFDPPQLGHLDAAHQVAELLKLDQVIFVPAGNPWQKSDVSSAQDRVQMLSLALARNPLFSLSTVDVQREGPSYTIDTLKHFSQTNPQDSLFFLMGNDAFAGITSWNSWQELGKYATLVVISRNSSAVEVPEPLSTSVNLLQVDTLPISSTQCREEIARNHSLENLVPEKVATYITEHHLYRRNS